MPSKEVVPVYRGCWRYVIVVLLVAWFVVFRMVAWWLTRRGLRHLVLASAGQFAASLARPMVAQVKGDAPAVENSGSDGYPV